MPLMGIFYYMYNVPMSRFDDELNKLNKEQGLAVETVEGPVMVVAGPGTGKTQILTLRVANILKKTQAEPENILVLTFTEAAAANIRRRLADIIGVPAYAINISTFHGFANNIIQSNPENFPNILGAKNITEIDQFKILEEIILKTDLVFLKTFGDPTYYIRDIAKAISDLKREGILPDEFNKIAVKQRASFDLRKDIYHEKGAHKGKIKLDAEKEQKYIDKNIELSEIYGKYQQNLRQLKLYDFGDMILELYINLKNDENLLRSIQEQYHYVLVDEHQDTNNAQNKIVELLMSFHDNPNIFVVGDEKQAIFRFQGASLENFYYFKRIYPSARLIYLTDNYRSGQPILDLANSLIRSEKGLISAKKHSTVINLYELASPDNEAQFVAQKIKSVIDDGVSPEEIGVLFRDNNDANLIASYLSKIKIRYDLKSNQNLFDDPYIKQLILILRALNNYGDDVQLIALLHLSIFNIEPLNAYKILRHCHDDKISLYDAIRNEKSSAYTIYYLLTRWHRLMNGSNLVQLITAIISESGLLSKVLMDTESALELEKLNLFADQIKALHASKPHVTLSDFIDYIDSFENYNVRLDAKINIVSKDAVKLMTAHGSKGLEFEHVFIMGMFDGHWGNKRKREMIKLPISIYALSGGEIPDGSDNDDERRLLFVAITRAKKHIYITYPAKNYDGRDLLPSMFLSEIDNTLIVNKPVDVALDPTLQYHPSNSVGPSITEKGFIVDLFKDGSLSVTGLNNYLKCPWNYYYNNLLRIPQAKDKHASYGTAVHNALRDLFSADNKTVEYLLKRFESHLEAEGLSNTDFNETRARGINALSSYFNKYNSTWNDNVILEYNVPAVELGDIKITGKIDKIEMLDKQNSVNVVDYKTGRSKTRNELMGKTQNSTGNERRQLVFYKLLLDKHKNGLYKMKSGEIDFIQPDGKNNFRKEQFFISDDDISELKQTIERVVDEITNLKFWDKYCDDKDCQYCALRRFH
jgi:DNA helicase-2/ATP-dependent DNA helicase PcrA